MHRALTSERRHHAGFSLLEVLISMLVLALGMLALAALFISSLSAGHQASLRSQASFLAYDIIESMRANRQAALAGDYDAGGDGSTLADDDVRDWQAQIRRTLPDGSGQLSVDGSRARITISWDEGRQDAAGKAQRTEFHTETGL